MSANYRATALICSPALTTAPPHGRGAGWAGFRFAVAALLRVRQLREALNEASRKRFAGEGGPQTPPEDEPTGESIWDDPMLWMLMMH